MYPEEGRKNKVTTHRQTKNVADFVYLLVTFDNIGAATQDLLAFDSDDARAEYMNRYSSNEAILRWAELTPDEARQYNHVYHVGVSDVGMYVKGYGWYELLFKSKVSA